MSTETGLHVQQPKATTVPQPTDLNEGNALLEHLDEQDRDGGGLGGGLGFFCLTVWYDLWKRIL